MNQNSKRSVTAVYMYTIAYYIIKTATGNVMMMGKSKVFEPAGVRLEFKISEKCFLLRITFIFQPSINTALLRAITSKKTCTKVFIISQVEDILLFFKILASYGISYFKFSTIKYFRIGH